ncbi:MAG: amino acid permease [Leptolyngbya sp. PLA3]|nr:MAG: amino acid permease [Cyanobacteria bacterium CYA]MCE7968614.1 amino acid permease [Leptolyngbya sp. PL-A3]
MLVTESRPRDLKWIHAGPLLYGDWGTSRLYVLGLAFFYTGHATVLYLAAIGLFMIAVSWAYTIVCRCFPDGGGVYTAARNVNPILAVIGSTLLLSGYIMTAAISVVEAFHYFGVSSTLTLPLSVATLVGIGVLNWLGARSAGRFALLIALGSLGVSGIMAIVSLPFFIRGLGTISFESLTHQSVGSAWVNFAKICLALSGIEAVANMTGLMKHPVERQARRTIWPVAIEVVVLNLFFGLVLAGLTYQVAGTSLAEMKVPDVQRLEQARAALIADLPPNLASGLSRADSFTLSEKQLASLDSELVDDYRALVAHEAATAGYTNASMRVIAEESTSHFFGPRLGGIFGGIAGITFGLLLLSATNTAVMAMVSVLYSMAQDHELPRPLTRLNFSGVPWIGLLASIGVSIAVIAVERDVTVLAKLYVLGVCGAITVTVVSTAMNRALDIGPRSRAGLWTLGAFLLSITLTIGVTQLESTAFSGTLIVIVLTTRGLLQRARRLAPEPIPTPATGWLAEVRAQEGQLQIDPSRPKIMLAARGRYQSEFAVDLAKKRDATLFAIFVRTVRVLDLRPGTLPTIDTDADAQEALASTGLLAKANRVPYVPIYVVAHDVVDEILDYTVTYGCDTLIMGKSRRSLFSRRLQGDIVAQVVESLPSDVILITRSADTPHESRLVMPPAASIVEQADTDLPSPPQESAPGV